MSLRYRVPAPLDHFLRDLLPQLDRVIGFVLPEAAHSINWEQPEAFNRIVLEFIGAH